MSSTKLKNAPLKEVVFELHWECSIDNSGTKFDPGFDLAQGKFAEKLRSEFPTHRKLRQDGAPISPFGIPLHQYWKGDLKWPVVQHGQGLIAVNEVEFGYVWESGFKPLVISTVKKIVESYEDPLHFHRVKLQYIDAWDVEEREPSAFMAENLQTNIVTRYDAPGRLNGFDLQQRYELSDGSMMAITIADALNNKNQKKSILWSINVELDRPLSTEQVLEWLEGAHSAASNMFKKMLSPDFYASLDR